MHKLKVLFILIAFVLVGVGSGLVVYSVINKSYDKLNAVTNTHEIGDFNNFDIDVRTADVILEMSDDDKCVVECDEKEKITHEVKVENDTLVIKEHDSRKWYEKHFIDFGITGMKITIYLTKTVYNDFLLDSSTGNITIDKALTFNNIDIDHSTGNTKLCNLNITNDLKIVSSTGNVKLDNVISNNMDIKTSTGNIKFTKIDAHSIKLKASTGNIYGDILTTKLFDVHTSTGSKQYPESGGVDSCVVHTSTGNVKITITTTE